MPDIILVAGGIKRGDNGRFLQSPFFLSLVFDSTDNIDYNFSNTVSNHPIDTKSNITDHIFNNNPRFTVTGTISNSVGENKGGVIVPVSSGRKRTLDAYHKLKSLVDNKTLITLATEVDIIPYCAVVGLKLPVDVNSADAFTFTLELERLRFVSSSRGILVTNTSEPLKKEVSSPKPSGEKTTDGGTSARDAKVQDILEKYRKANEAINEASANNPQI